MRWIALAIVVMLALATFGWAACALAGHSDDEMMRRYRQEREAFEEFFE